MKSLRTLFSVTALALSIGAGASLAADLIRSPLPPGPGTRGEVKRGAISITQSADPATIIKGNSIVCGIQFVGTGVNSYYRRFDLDGDHGITTPFAVVDVVFGVEFAHSDQGAQPLNVNLYTIPNASPLTLANLTPIGTLFVPLLDGREYLVTAPVNGTVANPLAHDLVVEIASPDGTLGPEHWTLFIGSNNGGQFAPPYLLAPSCNIPEPADLVALGYPSMCIIMVVNGDEAVPVAEETWGRVKALYR